MQKKGQWSGSSGRAPDEQARGPDFWFQTKLLQKKKIKKEIA
jgi:hypothetical protein